MITALNNRMLITISRTVEGPQSPYMPNGPLQTPFELSEMMTVDEGDPYASFIDMTVDRKGEAPRLPVPVPLVGMVWRGWGGGGA
jgi:hypothetical protein